MKVKIERKLKSNKPIKLGCIDKETSYHKKQRNAQISVNHDNHHSLILNQIQTDSNPALHMEAERQLYKGLLYANITRFR